MKLTDFVCTSLGILLEYKLLRKCSCNSSYQSRKQMECRETPSISYFFSNRSFPPVLFHQVPSFSLRNFARRRPCTRTLRNRGFASEDAEKAKDSFDSRIQGSTECARCVRLSNCLTPIFSVLKLFFWMFFLLGTFLLGFWDPDA